MAEALVDENINDDFESKIEQFLAVTGASVENARELLRVCHGNLEMAIGMHMDGSCDAEPACNAPPAGPSTSSSGAQASVYEDDGDEVRAPIPQTREVLVEEATLIGHRGRLRQSRSVFDGLRDFQAEARQQEESLLGGSGGGSKKRTLEDLFRPPIDITYKGTFQNARDTGTKNNKWLLINIQNVQEFPCQVLNRDIWSCPHIRKMVKEHFIFWQVYHDSVEGKKYMQFYKIKDWPYVAIVDPRTGENLAQWSKITSAAALRSMLQEFLTYHQSPDSTDSSPPCKRLKREPSIVDASEEDQIEAAIKASLTRSSPDAKDDSCIFVDTDSCESDDLETFSDSDEDSETPHTSHKTDSKKQKEKKSVESVPSTSCSDRTKEVKQSSRKQEQDTIQVEEESDKEKTDDSRINGHSKTQAEAKDDEEDEEEEVTPTGPEMSLLIRFPDGAKEQLNIPCDSTLKALLKFVTSKGLKSEEFELVTNFPRRQLNLLNPKTTLKDAGLHPKDTVFVHSSL